MDEEKRIKEIIDSLADLCGCKKESLYEYFLKNTVKKENDISKMTNRKWINSLTNEQLIKLFRTYQQDNCCCCAEEGKDECGYCFENQVKWLDEEHDSERWEERDQRYSFF